jgi:serine protease Do
MRAAHLQVLAGILWFHAASARAETELETAAARVKPAVVTLITFDALGFSDSLGTGFFVSEDGHLVTNHHVMDTASEMIAESPDGSKRRILGVLALDRDRDLALLKVEGTGHPFLRLGTSEGIKEGAAVGVFGAPLGLSWTLSHGTISAVDDHESEFKTGPGREFDRILRVSGTMMGQGNSGSPVFDMGGSVVGVIFAGIGEKGGISFAVPVEAVADLVARSAPVPTPLVAERQGRILAERARNLAISFAAAALAGGYVLFRGARRRILRRRLAALEEKARQFHYDA